MPRIARIALVLLWVAWIISACMVLVRSVQLGGADTATLVSLSGLLVQALIFYFVGRGRNAARVALLVVLVLGVPAFLVLFAVGFDVSLLPTSGLLSLVSLVLKVIACVLLFTPAARSWFGGSQMAGDAAHL
jgi:hypothetical protein